MRVVAVLLVLALLASLLGGTAKPRTARASQPAGDVIFNYPTNAAPGTPTSISELPYVKADHNGDGSLPGDDQGYDQAYTQDVSALYNGGVVTQDHVALFENQLSFYGYGQAAYRDYLFIPSGAITSSSGNAFTLVPANMNFHTFSEAGYLFNGTMIEEEGNTYYTGYALILACTNSASMLGDDSDAPNTASLRLYYLNHERWDTQTFRPGNVITSRILIATVKTGIQNLDPTSFRVNTEVDPDTRAFKVFVDGALCANVTAPIGGSTGPQGFGFYTGYYEHDCSVLTRIRFEDITLIAVSGLPDDALSANCEVKFLEKNTNTVIRASETETGMPGQKYRIVQPKKITSSGNTYYLVSNSKDTYIYSDIILTYKKNASDNMTTLYYVNLDGSNLESQELLARAPEKNARVNGGNWDPGAPGAPVLVTAGSQIEYRITAYAPPEIIGRPMMTQGDGSISSNTTWWNQAKGTTPSGSTLTAIDRLQVATVTFVNLSEHFDPSDNVANQFLAAYPSWNSRPVLRAWDATETTAANPDRDIQRVVAWATASAISGRYDIYVGGQGGVWMSAAPRESSLFKYLYYVSSIDFTEFHTDQATNMSNMFSNCAYYATTPPVMDLSGFDTSKVTDMSSMFYLFAHDATTPPVLDLTHFNTSRVTDMNNMFFCYAYRATGPAAVSLDLTHFNTAKVTNMSNMFNGFGTYSTTPPILDLTHFNTSQVTDMSGMFQYYGYYATTPPILDLTHFDTSQVTNMSDLFSYYAFKSPTPPVLDLTHLDTSKVTNMANMLRYYSNSSTAPPVLDLTHFNTAKVTNMSCLFQYYSYSSTTPPDLDLSRFDTSKVTNMVGMFQSYAYSSTVPYSLDLRWFKIGAATGGTDVTQMFLSCPQLTEVHLESGVFSTAPKTITNYANMFYGRNSDLNVYVGTPADQSWMQALSPAPVVVTVAGAPLGAQPTPLPVEKIPPLPVASSAAYTTITDTIPDGLTIDGSTITGDESATPTAFAITWQRDGQTITWSVPDDMLPADVSVKVTVETGLPEDTAFDNTAFAGSQPTNTTHHKLKAGWGVVEQYLISGTDVKLDDDVTTDVAPGAAYYVQGSLDLLSDYAYYGYQRVGIETTVTAGAPPAPAYDDGANVHSPDFASRNSETIKLYYRQTKITITVHAVDQDGSELKTPTTAVVPAGQDYYLLQSYLESFTAGGSDWNYFDYAKESDGSVKNTAPPAGSLMPGATPVYPGAATPTFCAADMTSDKDITLYFTTQKTVTVRFVEAGNPSHVLHPDETYFVAAPTFDATATVRTDDGAPLTGDLADPATGRAYVYGSYSIDEGAHISAAQPGVVPVPSELILYFSATYTVTEQFHDPGGNELSVDLSHDVTGGDPFFMLGDSTGNSAPPAKIGNLYYVGYRVGSDVDPLTSGYPADPTTKKVINVVFDDVTIIYVYQRRAGEDFTFYKRGEAERALVGVIFRLTPRNSEDTGWDSAEATTAVSADDGEVSFAGLADNTYLLEELRTTAGYALPSGYWLLTVDSAADPVFSFEAKGSPMAFAHDKETDLYTLTNYKVTRLPFSGGWGVIAFVVGGIVLLGAAVLGLTTLRTRKKYVKPEPPATRPPGS